MIIIGYPGIGKTSLAGRNNCIDLDAKEFLTRCSSIDEWVTCYCNLANYLSNQGYTVFVSSQNEIRLHLEETSNEQLLIIYPSLALKNEWINKLKVTHMITNLETDLNEYNNVYQNYESQIQAIMDSPIDKIEIQTMDYSLNKIIWGIQNAKLHQSYIKIIKHDKDMA